MEEPSSALTYAVRFRVIGKLFGRLCLVAAVLALVPLVVSLGFGEYDTGKRLVGVVLAFLLLSTLSRLKASETVQINEAMVVTALIFLVVPLVSSFSMRSVVPAFEDSVFEAVSAVTTTGLTTMENLEAQPRGFLFTRAWMQWYGGLGIVVLSLSVIAHPGRTARRLMPEEVDQADVIAGTTTYARRVLVIYGLATMAGVFLIWLCGGEFFESVLFSLAAVSTGGFSPSDASLNAFGGIAAQIAVLTLCIVGAVPFFLLIRLQRGRWKSVSVARGLVVALAIVFLAPAVLVVWSLVQAGTLGWSEALRFGTLTAVSAQTTSGFSAFPVSEFDSGSKLILILSMLVGGGAGSTAGGFKILRLLILIQALRHLVRSTALPEHAVANPRLGGNKLEPEAVKHALCLILLFLAVVILSWLSFLVMGYPPLDSLFEVVSATGTVGLSTGITAAELPVFLKGVLCVDMLLGRLEIVVWSILFWPGTWIGHRNRS